MQNVTALPWMVALRSINGLELNQRVNLVRSSRRPVPDLPNAAHLGEMHSEYRCGGSVGFSPTSQFNRHLK